MSVKLMSRVWDAGLPPLDKLVLLAMADFSNDEGLSWPSIATIARKTGVSERTVQRTLRWAAEQGFLERIEVKGVGCKYILKGRHSVTPDCQSPVTETTPRGDPQSPKPLKNHQVPSRAKALSVAREIDDALDQGCVEEGWKQETRKEYSWSAGEVDLEAQRFQDHARARGLKYKDWKAAWRNWCRSPYCKTSSGRQTIAERRREPLRV